MCRRKQSAGQTKGHGHRRAREARELTLIKRIFAAVAALALSACGNSGEQAPANGNPWASGPQPAGQPVAQQASAQAGAQAGEGAAPVHPAAEPPMPATEYGSCGHMHPGGQPPQIVNAEYAAAIQPTFKQLCYRAFHLGHSGRTRTSLWSAELLDNRRMEMASNIERDSNFEADDRLPEAERSELDDYYKSGYDRGHLAPSADMPSAAAQQESFRLSNIVPQNGRMNGGVWRDLEMQVRKEAYRSRVFVVTGPIFTGSSKALKRRVLVPSSMYKAMYVVNKGAVVFVVSNDDAARTTTLSLNQFASLYGIDPFPALVGPIRSHNLALGPMPLPEPVEEVDEASTASAGPGRKCDEYQAENGEWLERSKFFEKYGSYASPHGIRSCGSGDNQ